MRVRLMIKRTVGMKELKFFGAEGSIVDVV